MSDSEADSSPMKPSDPKIEQCLRGIVSRLLEAGDEDQLTVKRVRAAAEKQLQLTAGFFKADAKWEKKSKEIIKDAVDNPQDPHEEPESEPEPKKPKKSANGATAGKRGTKRAPSNVEEDAQSTKPTKKKRKVADEDETSSMDLNREESAQPQTDKEKEDSKDVDDEEEETTTTAGKTGPTTATMDDDDLSSLSSVRDSPPPQRKKRQKSDKDKPSKAKSKPSKSSKTKPAEQLPPQEAEIKRLQGWLVKCGIRKLWHKELAPYSTDKAKISHLKSMLSDAGMEGRFSEEKAKLIKERRELAADLEAVQEGNKMWGQSEGEEDVDEGARPKRKLAKGLRDISAFISDGEETD